jgi:hypothetical protein
MNSDPVFLERVTQAGGDADCLHCRLSIALQEYCQAEGIDPNDFVGALAQVAGEIIGQIPDLDLKLRTFREGVQLMGERCGMRLVETRPPATLN